MRLQRPKLIFEGARIYLGMHLWMKAEIDAAVTEFHAVQHLEPEWAVPLWSLGNLHESALQDFDSAQAFFERALELEPDCQEALKGLSRLFMKRGQKRLAKE